MRRVPCFSPARLLVFAAAAISFACGSGALVFSCGGGPDSEVVTELRTPTIDSAFEVQPGSTFAALDESKVGGLSALAFDVASGHLLALSDDRENVRIFRLRVREGPFAVVPVGVIHLRGAPVALDPEGLAVLPNGHLLVASEGVQNREPRSPPGLFEYTEDGDYVDQIELRDRFLPPATGPITRGVRGNASLESLAVSADGSRLFVGLETTLTQDDEPATFGHGTRTRILEYVRKNPTFVPAREWLYELEALPRVAYTPGLMINGLVELVAFDSSHLLALERAFVQNADDPAHSRNRVQIYRLSLDDGRDVSAFDSVAGRVDLTPVSKELLLDLDTAVGLPPGLAKSGLDNFEGMTFGPTPSQGGRRLFLVSDDNFSQDQRTWFLRLSF